MVERDDTTTTQQQVDAVRTGNVPGLAVVFENGTPTFRTTPIGDAALSLGRGTAARFFLDDDQLSRVHCVVSRVGEKWRIEDQSRYGTFVDGERVQGAIEVESPKTLRLGKSVLVFEDDVASLLGETVELRGTLVVGPRLRAAEREIVAAAAAGSDLLIHGESGTGKEWAAARYHAATKRSGPTTNVNCAALAENLFEGEVFGYVRGAFSGADRDRTGLFESANGGTIFLDEVGDLPLEMQPKLLRVLQERTIRRVGDARERPIDVRVVAATNRIVEDEVAAGRFRADLYWRLAQSSVRLPPLRERPEDLASMVDAELRRRGAPPPTAGAIEEVLLRDWEGNVRELTIALTRAARLAADASAKCVEAEHLPARPTEPPASVRQAAEEDKALRRGLSVPQILTALRQHRGNVSLAAQELRVHRNTLHRYISRYGIRVE